MKKYNGFTLIELMIVVAIIGVLGAISYPSYSEYMKKARRTDAKDALSIIVDRQERYYLKHGTYSDSLLDLEMTSLTENGYYKLSVASADLISGFTAVATAESTGAQANDTRLPPDREGDCTVLTLNSLGVKSAPLGNDPSATDPDVLDCW